MPLETLTIGDFEVWHENVKTVIFDGFASEFRSKGPVEHTFFTEDSVSNTARVTTLESAEMNGVFDDLFVKNGRDAVIELGSRSVFNFVKLDRDDGARVTDYGTQNDIVGGFGDGFYTLYGMGVDLDAGAGEDKVTVGTTAANSRINLADGWEDTIVFNSVVGDNELFVDSQDSLFLGETEYDLRHLEPGESETIPFALDGELVVTVVDDSFDFWGV